MSAKEALDVLARRKRKVQLFTRSFTIPGGDGNFITFSETIEGDNVVVSIQQEGKISTMRLSFHQWKALHELFYEVKCKEEPEYEDDK